MKTAIVHDWLTVFAGAENVLEAIYSIYKVPIYTLVANYENINNSFLKDAQVFTSFIQKFPKSEERYSLYLPFFPFAVEQFNLSEYDFIISSSHAVAKGVITKANQLHICYCHTPMRYAWDFYHQYMNSINSSVKKLIAKLVLHYIRQWDVLSSNRVDYFIANSKYVSRRIKKIYRRNSEVIYPPVDVGKFCVEEKKEDFYLVVSRFVPYKKVDIIVEAFSKLKNKKLVVIGDGVEIDKIKKKANSNVEILGYQPFNTVKEYMEKAKAFIFAAEEDFGITPVEAQACGTPVIAYKKGGALETVIDMKTGIFFEKQTVDSIIDAIKKFEEIGKNFNPYEMRKNAERFSKERFIKEFKIFVEKKKREFFS